MKKVLLLFSVIIILGLTGCSNKYFNDWFSSEQNETDKMCQQIIEACKQQDSEKLKSLFSEESKKNIENLDTEISAFFDYIEGSIQSFEGDCASSSESNYGKRKTELDGMYLILTEKERYCMNFYMYSDRTCLSTTWFASFLLRLNSCCRFQVSQAVSISGIS